MIVGLDISALDPNFKEHAQRGIGRYVRELKKYFDTYNSENKIPAVQYFDHRNVGGPVSKVFSRAIECLPVCRMTVKQQILLPFLYRNMPQFNLLHFPAHMDAPARGMPDYVLTVLDLIPQVLSDLYKADKPDWRFKLARYFENKSISNAKMLLCISECTARDVNRILGVPREKIRVTYLGVDEKFYKPVLLDNRADFLKKWKIPSESDLVLYVGGIDPRKNWKFALKVIKEMLNKSANKDLQLVMIGKIEKDREYPKLKAMISELGIENNIKFTGYLDDNELLKFYSISKVFFFPSLYEGFGLPPLEAMAAGLPVVSSNTSCMPEVLEDAALLVDPDNVGAAVEALSLVCNNKEKASELAASGKKQACKFTWEKTGQATLECYKENLDKH